jgi:VWFA-related protein
MVRNLHARSPTGREPRAWEGRFVRVLQAALAAACLLAGMPGPRADEPTPHVDDATLERLLKLPHTESHQVRLVMVPTSVTDKKGRLVRELTKGDFRLFEDREPREIRYFTSELREPLSIAFLLDVSGSMRQLDKLTHAKEAIRHFVAELRPDDRFALICFADEQVAWITEFTSDRTTFLRRLEVQVGYGQTALHDAIAAAPALVDQAAKGRRAIVLITDGVDNASKTSIDNAVAAARRVSVPVYAIGLLAVEREMLPKASRGSELEIVRHVSLETGGRLYAVHDPVDVKEAALSIEAELRQQYVLGYYPGDEKFDGRFHELRVETARKRFSVRARSGFFGER